MLLPDRSGTSDSLAMQLRRFGVRRGVGRFLGSLHSCFEQAIEHTVDESRAIFAAVSLGEREGFADRNLTGRLRE